MQKKCFWGLVLCFLLPVLQGGFRLWKNTQKDSVLRWDPRDANALRALQLKSDQDKFEKILSLKNPQLFEWPALRSLQLSREWLRLLQGMDSAKALEGKYSWFYQRLYKIVQLSPLHERKYLLELAPYYFVMGKDLAGMNYLAGIITERDTLNWRAWFWASFHYAENLKNRAKAAVFMKKAAQIKEAPPFTAALALRYEKGSLLNDVHTREKALELLSPELLEKVKKARPEWF